MLNRVGALTSERFRRQSDSNSQGQEQEHRRARAPSGGEGQGKALEQSTPPPATHGQPVEGPWTTSSRCPPHPPRAWPPWAAMRPPHQHNCHHAPAMRVARA